MEHVSIDSGGRHIYFYFGGIRDVTSLCLLGCRGNEGITRLSPLCQNENGQIFKLHTQSNDQCMKTYADRGWQTRQYPAHMCVYSMACVREVVLFISFVSFYLY